jgi:hypothetical protein
LRPTCEQAAAGRGARGVSAGSGGGIAREVAGRRIGQGPRLRAAHASAPPPVPPCPIFPASYIGKAFFRLGQHDQVGRRSAGQDAAGWGVGRRQWGPQAPAAASACLLERPPHWRLDHPALASLPAPQSEAAYQRALQVNDKAPPAWQGLAELYANTRQWAKAAEAYQALVRSGVW